MPFKGRLFQPPEDDRPESIYEDPADDLCLDEEFPEGDFPSADLELLADQLSLEAARLDDLYPAHGQLPARPEPAECFASLGETLSAQADQLAASSQLRHEGPATVADQPANSSRARWQRFAALASMAAGLLLAVAVSFESSSWQARWFGSTHRASNSRGVAAGERSTLGSTADTRGARQPGAAPSASLDVMELDGTELEALADLEEAGTLKPGSIAL